MLRVFEEKNRQKSESLAKELGVSMEGADRTLLLDEDGQVLGMAIFFVDEKAQQAWLKEIAIREGQPVEYHDFLLRSVLNLLRLLQGTYKIFSRCGHNLESFGFLKASDGSFEIMNTDIIFACQCNH